MSERFQNLIGKQAKNTTVGTFPTYNRQTKYTTPSERFQNRIEKQNLPPCQKVPNSN